MVVYSSDCWPLVGPFGWSGQCRESVILTFTLLVSGIDIVFHVATAAPTGANSLNNQLMESVNIKGTRNVINGCVKQKVKRLIFTSSASVVFDGHDLIDVDEGSVGYATKPMDYYTKTKVCQKHSCRDLEFKDTQCLC